MADKVAIVGYSGTISLTPWGDDEWDIFTMNHRFDKIKRTTKHFDIHNAERIKANPAYLEWLKIQGDKVLLASPMPELPQAELYPKKEIEDIFKKFFTNSVSWMIAYAINQGYKEIALYGIDLGCKDEYAEQRPSVLYYLGYLEGKGIKLTLPDNCHLFDHKEYWNG